MGDFVNEISGDPFDWNNEGSISSVTTSTTAVRDLVEDRFEKTLEIAEDMLERLVGSDGNSGYLGTLNSIITQYNAPPISVDPIVVPDPSINVEDRPMPDLDNIDTDFPEFDKNIPILYSIPTVDVSSVTPGAAPIQNVSDLTWVDGSSILSWVERDSIAWVGDIASAVWTEQGAVSIDATDYNPWAEVLAWSNLGHDTTLFAAIIGKLTTDLADGATGLPADVEQEIWDRAIARQTIDNDRRYEEVDRLYSGSRWDLPSGAYIAGLKEVSDDIARSNLDLNGKIMIEQAELAQKNNQFVMQISRELEAMLRDFVGGESNRLLEYANKVNDRALQSANLINELMSKEGDRTLEYTNQVNNRALEYYSKASDIIDRKNGRVLENNIKVNEIISQSNNRALEYALKTNELDSRKSDRSLDYAKAVAAHSLAIYSEAIRAYIATAEVNKIYVEVQVENLKAVVEYNKGLIQSFIAEVEAYSQVIEAKAKKNEAFTDIFKAEIDGYDSETKAISENKKTLIDSYRLKIENADSQLRGQIASAANYLEGYKTEYSLREKVAETMANIAMQSVASAQGAVNASAGISHQSGNHSSDTVSHSETRAVGYSISNALQESHSYDETKATEEG